MFENREEAGKRLAQALAQYGDRDDVVVLALPRGGVPVAFEVARELGAPLDVLVVRKLGLPGQPELAMGAIASGGAKVFNESVLAAAGDADKAVAQVLAQESQELARREKQYRGDRVFPDVNGQIVIVVDDGIATGATMRAAVAALKSLGPAKIVVAAPVGAPRAVRQLEVDAEVVCITVPSFFGAVGAWYQVFGQTGDEEVQRLLELASGDAPAQ